MTATPKMTLMRCRRCGEYYIVSDPTDLYCSEECEAADKKEAEQDKVVPPEPFREDLPVAPAPVFRPRTRKRPRLPQGGGSLSVDMYEAKMRSVVQVEHAAELSRMAANCQARKTFLTMSTDDDAHRYFILPRAESAKREAMTLEDSGKHLADHADDYFYCARMRATLKRGLCGFHRSCVGCTEYLSSCPS